MKFERIESNGKSIEVLWAAPAGEGPWPLLLFVHGHTLDGQGASIHQNILRSQRRLNRWKVCVASVSQPGYGKSDGPADYCGPKTQKAILDVLEFFRQNSKVDPSKIALIGYSRGAVASAMVATVDPGLAALVLGAGFYDFETYYQVVPNKIREAIKKETELTEIAFQNRSALNKAELIAAPTLIFHGALDERGGYQEAQELAKNIPKSRLKLYPDDGHHIPFRKFYRESRTFLLETLMEFSTPPAPSQNETAQFK